MTRAGILTKYSLGYMLPGKASLSWVAGKILQMVSRAWESVGEKEASVTVGGKRIEGAREKKIGALGGPDRNTPPRQCDPSHRRRRRHLFRHRHHGATWRRTLHIGLCCCTAGGSGGIGMPSGVVRKGSGDDWY